MAELTIERPRFGWTGAITRTWLFFRRWPVFSTVIVVIFIVAAIFAPLIEPHDPVRAVLRERNTPPVWYAKGSATHILGTDYVGRDVLSRVIHGARVSLLVVTISTASGLLVGVTLGLIAGYAGRLTDEIVMRIVDIWLGLPLILIALVIVIVFGQSFPTLMAVLALFAWSPFVRNVRAETLSLKGRDYVSLARVAGASNTRILVIHILPGVINTIIVIATLRTGQLIMTEAILSFLGAGIPPPTPAWGAMVNDGRGYLRDAWWISFFPGLAIFLITMSLNFLGDWFRDKYDPRLRQL